MKFVLFFIYSKSTIFIYHKFKFNFFYNNYLKFRMKDWVTLMSPEHFLSSNRKVEGLVIKISDGVVTIRGLESASAGEMIRVSTDDLVSSKNNKSAQNFVYAMVLNLGTDRVEAIIFGDESKVKEGTSAELCHFPVQLSVGLGMLGRVVDPLGNFVDGKGSDNTWTKTFKKVDIKAPGIIQRESVTESMETGIKAVDSMVPIGRGQRELIIGDRQTGKTAVAVDAILHQGNAAKPLKGVSVFPADLQNDFLQNDQFAFLDNAYSIYEQELNISLAIS
jgi:F0F1-type ATP synthase alpha subunit